MLCLFLLDMGLIAGRGLHDRRGRPSPGLLGVGGIMPLIGATAGCAAGLLLGLSTGGVGLLLVLGASASYIAVPAAMRVALPETSPSIYLTLTLTLTPGGGDLPLQADIGPAGLRRRRPQPDRRVSHANP